VLADIYNSTDQDEGVDVFYAAVTSDEKDQLIDSNNGYETIHLTNFTMTPIGGKENQEGHLYFVQSTS
jgi:hypothetical protein